MLNLFHLNLIITPQGSCVPILHKGKLSEAQEADDIPHWQNQDSSQTENIQKFDKFEKEGKILSYRCVVRWSGCTKWQKR